MKGRALLTPRSVENEGEEVLHGIFILRRHLTHRGDHGEATLPLLPMEICGGYRDPPAANGGAPHCSRWMPKRSLWEAHPGVGTYQGDPWKEAPMVKEVGLLEGGSSW